MSSKYDGFSYGQLYAHYDSVIQLSQSVTATSVRAAELQRELGQIRMALHAKTQERIDVWNGTPNAQETVCQNKQTAAQEQTKELAKIAASRKTAATSPKPRSERARSLPKKKSAAQKRCASARRAGSTTKDARARARSKRR